MFRYGGVNDSRMKDGKSTNRKDEKREPTGP